MEIIIVIVSAAVALIAGALAGYAWRKKVAQALVNSSEAKAEKILLEAKTKQQEYILQGQEKATKMIDEAKREDQQMRVELRDIKARLEKRENMFDQKLLEFQGNQTKLQEKVDRVNQIKGEIEKLREQEVVTLQNVANMTRDEAKEQLIAKIEEENKNDLAGRLMKLQKEDAVVYEEKAREIIMDAIQRCASSHAAETTSSIVHIPSEDMKGRIIGKEGRNIKTIEKLTGCELVIDDTPESIMVSGFSPIRRQVAKLALEKLMSDGRIQPARIEEAVEKARDEIGNKIQEAGEAAAFDTGIAGLDPKLVKILGRLRFRTSYGQNVLLHSVEVAHLAAAIAAEIGADANLAKKAGLLHDIGKAITHEVQGSHVEIGKMILQKFNMPEDV